MWHMGSQFPDVFFLLQININTTFDILKKRILESS